MRYPVVLLIPALVIGISLYSSTKAEVAQPDPSGEALYTQWCQDCHGLAGRDFIDRTWKLGSRDEDIARVIREGHELLGMPAYGETLNDEEVESLTQFVLDKASNETRFYPAGPRVESTSDLEIRADIVVDGLETPWGMDFTDDDALLITEREGRLWHLKAGKLSAVSGLPSDIVVKGQGGLLDVAFWTDPTTDSSWVYLTYSRLHPLDKDLSATGLVRGEIGRAHV